jgi:hypothetical protein
MNATSQMMIMVSNPISLLPCTRYPISLSTTGVAVIYHPGTPYSNMKGVR